MTQNFDISKLSLEDILALKNAVEQKINEMVDIDQKLDEAIQDFRNELIPEIIPEIIEVEDDYDPNYMTPEALAETIKFNREIDRLNKLRQEDARQKRIKKEKKYQDQLEGYLELVRLGFAEEEEGETEYETMILKKLRDKREQKELKQLSFQYSIAKYPLQPYGSWFDLIFDYDLMYVHRNFKDIVLQKAHDALYKYNAIIKADIQVFYAYSIPPEPGKDNIEYGLAYSALHWKNNDGTQGARIPATINNFGPNVDPKKITLYFNEKEDSETQKIWLGYRISYATRGPMFNKDGKLKPQIKKTIHELKAYSPTNCRKYHELTSGSTTSDKLCIYETFLDIIDKRTLKYKRHNTKNSNEVKSLLSKEGQEIENSVKNGELVKSLELLTKKYNNEIAIIFYKRDNDDELQQPIIINNGESKQSEDISKFYGKKCFLYMKDRHVAPMKLKKKKVKEEQIEKHKNDKYTLFPNKLKINEDDNEEYDDIIKTELNKRRKRNIVGFDTETFLDEKNMCTVFCITMYGKIKGKIIKEKIYGDYEYCINKFVKFIESITVKINMKSARPKEPIEDIYIYGFNNSRFDNLFIYEALYKSDDTVDILFTNNSIKTIKYHNVRIFDISLYYTGSLASVSEAFKLEITKGVYPYSFPNKDNLNYIGPVPDKKYFKSEEDYNQCYEDHLDNIKITKIKNNKISTKFDLKEYTEKYCLLDSQLVYEIAVLHLQQCLQFINYRICDVQKCGTGAAIALRCYQQVFQDDWLTQSPNEIIKNERDAYKGGRTEVFKKMFKTNGNSKLYYYDINSAHPASMIKPMPYKYIKTEPFNNDKLKYDDLVDSNNYLASIKYIGKDKNFIPNILIRSKGHIIACENSDYAYHWGIELKEAIKNGCEITVKSCDMYESKELFSNFSNYFYNERLKVKKTNAAKSQFFKLLLNSLYGKFGQKLFTKRILLNNCNEMYQMLGDDKYLCGLSEIGNKILVEYEEADREKKSIGNLVRFSSYISACTRCKLSEVMRDIGHEHIYYCDTDSIFTDKKPSDIFLDNEKIGYLKLETGEHLIDIAYFLAPKSYCYALDNGKIKNASKGVDSKKLTIDNYEDLYTGKVKSVVQNRGMFFRSFEGVKIEEHDRSISVVYNKRIWDNNESKPFKNIYEWEKHNNEVKESEKLKIKQIKMMIKRLKKVRKIFDI